MARERLLFLLGAKPVSGDIADSADWLSDNNKTVMVLSVLEDTVST
jgi:hypothetical protein